MFLTSYLVIILLFQEYETQSSEESKIVKDFDKFDMILQAYEYERTDNRPRELQEFFDSTQGNYFLWDFSGIDPTTLISAHSGQNSLTILMKSLKLRLILQNIWMRIVGQNTTNKSQPIFCKINLSFQDFVKSIKDPHNIFKGKFKVFMG